MFGTVACNGSPRSFSLGCLNLARCRVKATLRACSRVPQVFQATSHIVGFRSVLRVVT